MRRVLDKQVHWIFSYQYNIQHLQFEPFIVFDIDTRRISSNARAVVLFEGSHANSSIIVKKLQVISADELGNAPEELHSWLMQGSMGTFRIIRRSPECN